MRAHLSRPVLTVLGLGIGAAAIVPGCMQQVRRGPLDEGPKIDSPALARGQKIFMKHCNQCHPGTLAGLGPTLGVPLPGPVVKAVVRSGPGTLAAKGLVPPMPAFGQEQISDPELDDLVEYLKAVRAAK